MNGFALAEVFCVTFTIYGVGSYSTTDQQSNFVTTDSTTSVMTSSNPTANTNNPTTVSAINPTTNNEGY